jgi:hypothetical protein
MNIIQIQDRLKGLPTDALVNYVEQPMGEVPIYLALGELQRRKEMKERFQADQMPPPSVAEQIVAENKPQPMAMGLGAMAPQQMMPGAQGVGTPPPAPEMDPRQLAASGIAANPVSNVGSPVMMAAGGIVPGFKVGGQFTDDIIEKQAKEAEKLRREIQAKKSTLQKTKEGIKNLTDKVGDSKVAKRIKNVPLPGVVKRHPIAASLLGIYGLSSLFGDDDLKVPPALDKVSPGEMYNIAYEDVPTLQQGIDAFNQQLPPSATREALDARVLEMQERIDKDRGDAGNMALIQAGLNIAAGQSPNAISNIATGATAGMQDYTQRLKDADKSELTTLQLRQGLEEADRREKLAALQFGNMSREAVLARNAKKEISELLYFSQERKLENAYRMEIIKNDEGYSNLESQLRELLAAEKITTEYYTEQLKNYVDAAVAQKTSTVGDPTTTADNKEAADDELERLIKKYPET